MSFVGEHHRPHDDAPHVPSCVSVSPPPLTSHHSPTVTVSLSAAAAAVMSGFLIINCYFPSSLAFIRLVTLVEVKESVLLEMKKNRCGFLFRLVISLLSPLALKVITLTCSS